MILLAAVALVAVIIGFRVLMTGGPSIATVQASAVPTLDRPITQPVQARDGMQVTVKRSTAEIRPLYVSLQGRTKAARAVTVRSETTGTLTSAPAVEGRIVERGEVLCVLDVDAKAAKVREAEAEAKRKQIDYSAAMDLVAKGWAPEARATTMKAAYDASLAALEVAKAEMAKTQIRAPFKGIFEKRLADTGDFLAPGGECGSIVQLDPIVVEADAPESSAGSIHIDAPAKLRMTDGSEASGRVRYIAKTADPASREFAVEVEIANPANAIPVGRSLQVRVQTGQGDAHKVSPSMLWTDEQGRVGVRYLDVGGVVSFAPSDSVGDASGDIWVPGLPKEALLIAEGQETVRPGIRATPVFADGR